MSFFLELGLKDFKRKKRMYDVRKSSYILLILLKSFNPNSKKKPYRCNTIYCSITPAAVCKRTTKTPLATEGVLVASKTTSFKPLANACSDDMSTFPNKSQTVNFALPASGKVKEIVVSLLNGFGRFGNKTAFSLFTILFPKAN